MSEGVNKNRWNGVVGTIWLLAVLSVVAGAALIASYGTYETPSSGLYGGSSETRYNIAVWASGISQAVFMIIVATAFSILKSIYQNTCGSAFLIANEPDKASSAATSSFNERAVSAADGKGIIVRYINETSPLHGTVSAGNILLKINGAEVVGVRQAASCLVDGENNVAFIDSSGEHLERSFMSSRGASLSIRSA
ncbi:hypothetical protein [Salinicola aestuarinus]|uniref:hypothetical protein n=1 Tax=Salinicola aestuarinus TaxID=1949082 RepID=UPI0013003323|nr:hypothetical protein [Salinicola aestuarinus]